MGAGMDGQIEWVPSKSLVRLGPWVVSACQAVRCILILFVLCQSTHGRSNSAFFIPSKNFKAPEIDETLKELARDREI